MFNCFYCSFNSFQKSHSFKVVKFYAEGQEGGWLGTIGTYEGEEWNRVRCGGGKGGREKGGRRGGDN